MPELVGDLATYAGIPRPAIVTRAVNSATLQDHIHDSEPGNARAQLGRSGGWDAVVLQEFSTRPTRIGDPQAFERAAAELYNFAIDANPESVVVLFETWARAPGHALYPGRFASAEDMQADLRRHYQAVAEVLRMRSDGADVRVAPVGDAWEQVLAEDRPIRLHYSDGYHANAAGKYLAALVLFGTLFGARAGPLPPLLGVPKADAARLQAVVADFFR